MSVIIRWLSVLPLWATVMGASGAERGTEGAEDVRDFIMGLPKTELHIHLEGTIEPEDYLVLVEKNGIDSPYASAEAVRERLTYQKDLNTFIEVYEELLSALYTKKDFEDAVVTYAERVSQQGVVYVEMFFDPQMHTSRGIPLEDVMEGIRAGKDRAAAEHGVEIFYIACFNRDRSAESAMEHLEKLATYKGLIIGIGLDNPEIIGFPSKFAAVFKRAGELGFNRTTHLDVNVPNTVPHHHGAISELNVDRIDHGLNVIDDPVLVKASQTQPIPLASCVTLLYRHIPGSDETKARLDDRFGRLVSLLESNILISLNSDDPGLMQSLYVGDLYWLGYEEGYLTLDQVITLARNSIEMTWLSNEKKATYLAQFEIYLKEKSPRG